MSLRAFVQRIRKDLIWTWKLHIRRTVGLHLLGLHNKNNLTKKTRNGVAALIGTKRGSQSSEGSLRFSCSTPMGFKVCKKKKS